MSTPPNTPEQPTDYPAKVGCRVLPALENDVVPVELTDWNGNALLYDVPPEFVQKLDPPRLSADIPAEARKPFEDAIGIGLLACKLINRDTDTDYDLVSLQIPSVPEPAVVVMPFGAMSRRSDGSV
jgi:hypothetical protein